MTAELQRQLADLKASPIDCSGCTKCCIGESGPVAPDELDAFPHEPHLSGFVLPKSSEGSCIYLATGGCSIHGAAPRACQEFDCRVRALGLTSLSWPNVVARLRTTRLRDCILEGCDRLQADSPELYAVIEPVAKAARAMASA